MVEVRLKKRVVAVVVILGTVVMSIMGIVNKIDGVEIHKDITGRSECVQEAVEEVIQEGYMTSQGKGVFNPDGNITIEQTMKILARVLEEDEEKYKEVAIKEGLLRPSDMVYSKDVWEETWSEIIKGKKVFDKVEDKYLLTIIPGYFRIQLNEQGYEVVKKGMVPQQISFYTPFMDIYSYTPEVLESKATMGFFIEMLSLYDISQAYDEYTGKEQQQRQKLMQELTKAEIREKDGEEEMWGQEEYNKYNFMGISYNGQMRYAKARGILPEETTLVDMNKAITRVEAAVLIKRVRGLDRDGLEEQIQGVIETGYLGKQSGAKE